MDSRLCLLYTVDRIQINILINVQGGAFPLPPLIAISSSTVSQVNGTLLLHKLGANQQSFCPEESVLSVVEGRFGSIFWLACPTCSFILNPTLDHQSGFRRQCLGVGAKTVEALGVVMTLGFFNSLLDQINSLTQYAP